MRVDPRSTFDTFVVGPANRLAAAAARRAADSPGSSYNPLFLYSASGLGKSHILAAVANHARKSHQENRVVYQTLEGYLDELTTALEAGDQEGMRERYRDLDVLLLDDVQFLTGQPQAQELLLRTLDSLTAQGSQVILASDRPPAEINGLDARLLSRFSGGLIVDISPPDYETRVAILRRKVEERNGRLRAGVAETMARHPFRNVRELQGALNRVLAVQDLEDRQVEVEELDGLVGVQREGAQPPPSVDAAKPPPEEPKSVEWRDVLSDAVSTAEEEGFQAGRLRRIVEVGEEPEDPEALVAAFQRDVSRLKAISEEMEGLDNPWPEAQRTILRDPERLEEAEALLASARERARSFPPLLDGPVLSELDGGLPSLAIRAAERFVLQERPDYNPLFIVSPSREEGVRILQATGRTLLGIRPRSRVALVSVEEFAQDFIRAISEGVAGAWRERWWSADLLLLHGAEALSETERAQDEFFHLFEALKRREARVLLASDRPPSEIPGIDERLRSRFEGGLVVELRGEGARLDVAGKEPPPDPPPQPSRADPDPFMDVAPVSGAGESTPAGRENPSTPSGSGSAPHAEEAHDAEAPDEADDPLAAIRKLAGLGREGAMEEASDVVVEPPVPEGEEGRRGEPWSPNPEKVVWRWPRLEDRMVEEVD